MLNELFSRMQCEPTVLLVGNKYKSLKTFVLDYAWNLVVTTNCELEFAAALNNGKRLIRDIISKNEMQANLMDRKNLHIIRLFGETYPSSVIDEIDAEDIKQNAVTKLSRVSDIIKRNGIVLIEDFEESLFTHKELRSAFSGLYSNQKQLYVFNCKKKEDPYLSRLEKQGIAVLIDESINNFFENYISGEEEALSESSTTIQIYIEAEKSLTPTYLEKKYLLETESFASLLNVGLLNEVRIPPNMYKDYFYLFLKNSVREPQWYGFSYGFNIHRSYEELLYKKVKKGLENVGKEKNKPLLVVGQTSTGKTISLAAIAYKIFNEKKYPVVYINDPDVNFYSNTEYKEKNYSKKSSPAFTALDTLLERLENLGAKATFLVWDTSSYSRERKKIYNLYQHLLARGRKVFLLSSAYEVKDETSLPGMQEENVEINLINRKFEECLATIEVSDEVDQLKSILLEKCNMSEHEVAQMLGNYNDKNFLTVLYQRFDFLRGDLSKGVYKEASVNLRELDKILEEDTGSITINNVFAYELKRIEKELISAGLTDGIEDPDEVSKTKIEVQKDDFIKCIAICSQFKLKMPYDFALRILGTYNSQIIRTLTKSTFFVITEDYHGNYEISLRTSLEAQMYISAKGMKPLDEIKCIEKMLDYMNPGSEYGQYREVRLCERLLVLVGPNNDYRSKYQAGYESLIKKLKTLREDKNIWEPNLVAQEITYLREYYGRDENLERSQRVEKIKEAIRIADEIFSKVDSREIMMGIRNAITVESANSKILLCQLEETNDKLFYKEIRRDLNSVIKSDQNIHAYVTLLKGSLIEFKNETDEVRRVDLLEKMCSVADEMTLENPDVENSKYFQTQVAEIYSLLDNSETLNNYVDELIANGSAAGLYVVCRKILHDNLVKYKESIWNDIQLDACKKVYEILNDKKNKSVVDESESCQNMLFNIVWLMNNKEPVELQGECWLTKMHEDVWRELLSICNNYLLRFCNNSEEIHRSEIKMKYLKALCLGQLGQYIESRAVLKSIEEDSTMGLSRVTTKHMLCDENGVPLKFVGKLGKYDEIKRSGRIFINEFGTEPIYFHGPNMKSSKIGDEGYVFNDVEIGYSSFSLKAYREVE